MAKRGRKIKDCFKSSASIRLDELHPILKRKAFETNDSICGVIRKALIQSLSDEERQLLSKPTYTTSTSR